MPAERSLIIAFYTVVVHRRNECVLKRFRMSGFFLLNEIFFKGIYVRKWVEKCFFAGLNFAKFTKISDIKVYNMHLKGGLIFAGTYQRG